jgi:hypothetical protein
MMSFSQFLDEGKRGLWDNIHAKRKRIAAGSNERMRKPGSEGAPSKQNFIDAEKTSVKENFMDGKNPQDKGDMARHGLKGKSKSELKQIRSSDTASKRSKQLAHWYLNMHKEDLDESAAWQRKEGKNPKGGLNQKGIASYRRENPGSKLSMAVTTPPSKLDPDSKSAKRRKSFCARMSGVDGPMKEPDGEPTRKALALRKWNC